MMLAVLGHMFVDPLMMIYSVIYRLPLYWIQPNPGLQLIIFSVLLNLGLMPLYRQMEKRSAAGRAIREKVAAEVARMKRHFKGRERYFYIRAVYRSHGYHPISELLGSADLLVQIVVFVTVLRFMEGGFGLAGQSLGPISNLGRPDGLLAGVNLLPLLMTAFNAASVFFYVPDRRKRLQAWALAAIFLLLLYRSPAALALYWTMNNLFSLIRNFIQSRLRDYSMDALIPNFARLGAQR